MVPQIFSFILDNLCSFPKGSFTYHDTEGFWVLGGTEGSQTFKGIIGHTRIYRRHLLFAEQVKESAVHLNLLTLFFFYHFSFASCLNFLHNCLTYGKFTKNE